MGKPKVLELTEAERLNIFGMIDRDNRYKGFTTFEKMTAGKVVSFLDEFSFNLKMDTLLFLTTPLYIETRRLRNSVPYGSKEAFPLLPASIFATIEYCGNTLAYS